MPHTEAAIRPLATRADYTACVDLQRAVWGEHFADVVSPTILMVSQRLGGVAAGAFDPGGRLLGFVFGMTGIRDGEAVHWSDMLAVRPEARGGGLGKRLKLYQRDELLGRGVRRMQWTYDPLVARNANLNLNGLGAVPVEYSVNLYGDTGSTLHAGLDTDRFIVEWRLDEALPSGGHAVAAVAASVPPAGGAGPATDAAPADVGSIPIVDVAWAPGERPLPAAPRVRVAAPADVDALKAADASHARAWRRAQRLAFTHYLGRGYRVSGFVHNAPPADSYYLLTKAGEPAPDAPEGTRPAAPSALGP